MPRSWRSRILRAARVLLLIVVGLFVGLLLAELVLRLVYDLPAQERALVGWQFSTCDNPGIPYLHLRSCPTCRPETNSLGLLGPEPPAARDGLVRVAMVGDSMCAGYPHRYEQTMPARLEDELAQRAPSGTEVRVISYCIGGFDLPELEAMLRTMVLPARPDLVLLLPYINDNTDLFFLTIQVPDQEPQLYVMPRGERRGPFAALPDELRRVLGEWSFLYQELQSRLARLEVWAEDAQPPWVMLTEEQIRNLVAWQVAVAHRAGIPLAVVPLPPARHTRCLEADGRMRPFPDIECFDDGTALDAWIQRYRAWQLPVLDLRPMLGEVRERDLALGGEHEDVVHYNAEGHSLVARVMAPFVADRLWPPEPRDAPPSPVDPGEDAPPSP